MKRFRFYPVVISTEFAHIFMSSCPLFDGVIALRVVSLQAEDLFSAVAAFSSLYCESEDCDAVTAGSYHCFVFRRSVFSSASDRVTIAEFHVVED